MEYSEIPEYFLCPISHQVMQDPVTSVSGITYDRTSIERWLFSYNKRFCPVTMTPLSSLSDLIPNHTLRRLIHAWSEASHYPLHKTCIDISFVVERLKGLTNSDSQQETLSLLLKISEQNEDNKKVMMEAGVPNALLNYITGVCHARRSVKGLREALHVLNFVGMPCSDACKELVRKDNHVVKCLTWILTRKSLDYRCKSNAVWVLKSLFQLGHMETLEEDFILSIITFLKEGTGQRGVNFGLQALLEASRWARNRVMMVEAGAVFRLIEIDMGSSDKQTAELVLCILAKLCASEEGQAHFLCVNGVIEWLTQKILRVSCVADDRALAILLSICRNPMLNNNILTNDSLKKVFLLLQGECCGQSSEHKAREILKHYYATINFDPTISHTVF